MHDKHRTLVDKKGRQRLPKTTKTRDAVFMEKQETAATSPCSSIAFSAFAGNNCLISDPKKKFKGSLYTFTVSDKKRSFVDAK